MFEFRQISSTSLLSSNRWYICMDHEYFEKLCTIAFWIVAATQKDECTSDCSFCNVCHVLDNLSFSWLLKHLFCPGSWQFPNSSFKLCCTCYTLPKHTIVVNVSKNNLFHIARIMNKCFYESPLRDHSLALPSLVPTLLWSSIHYWSVSLYATCKQKNHMLYILLNCST